MSSIFLTNVLVMKTIYADDYRLIINHLIEVRKRGQITQLDIAQKLNKPQSYVAKIENFERKLDILEFVQLCQVLEVKASEVVGLIESGEKK